MEYYFNGERILCEYIGDFLFIDYSIYVIIVLI